LTRPAIVITACVAVIAAGVETTSRFRRRAGWRALQAQMDGDWQEGSLQGLLRARIAGARVLASEPENAPVVAQLAFISAWLAHAYGLRATREAEEAVARLSALPDRRPIDVDLPAALLALDRGERRRALELAVAASRQDREDLRPLLVLSRARALAGDPLGASKAAEAAIVREPRAGAPQLAFADARLALGHGPAAEKALREVLGQVPDHGPALLLWERARQARPGPATADDARAVEALAAACRRDGAVSPVLAAGCDLVAASAARAAGDRPRALELVQAAAGRKSDEPEVLARAALLLAQLGRVDQADALATAAARTAAAEMPALAWAHIAISLGRGELALPPPGLTPACNETRLVAARAALTAAGPPALAQLLTSLGPAATAADADLRALATLVKADGAAEAAAGAVVGPVQAYALGLRARLAGDVAGAARWLAGALDGHGDACRAAGEYVAAARRAGQTVTTELDRVRAVNTQCQNLALPPPPERKGGRRKPAR
jgi:hypothetical protein